MVKAAHTRICSDDRNDRARNGPLHTAVRAGILRAAALDNALPSLFINGGGDNTCFPSPYLAAEVGEHKARQAQMCSAITAVCTVRPGEICAVHHAQRVYACATAQGGCNSDTRVAYNMSYRYIYLNVANCSGGIVLTSSQHGRVSRARATAYLHGITLDLNPPTFMCIACRRFVGSGLYVNLVSAQHRWVGSNNEGDEVVVSTQRVYSTAKYRQDRVDLMLYQ